MIRPDYTSSGPYRCSSVFSPTLLSFAAVVDLFRRFISPIYPTFAIRGNFAETGKQTIPQLVTANRVASAKRRSVLCTLLAKRYANQSSEIFLFSARCCVPLLRFVTACRVFLLMDFSDCLQQPNTAFRISSRGAFFFCFLFISMSFYPLLFAVLSACFVLARSGVGKREIREMFREKRFSPTRDKI